MYDDAIRMRAVSLVRRGMTPSEASRYLGGKPGRTTISLWADGHIPAKKRSPKTNCSLEDKLHAVLRVEAGEHYAHVAKDLGCAPATVLVWRRKFMENGIDGLKTHQDLRREAIQRALEDEESTHV